MGGNPRKAKLVPPNLAAPAHAPARAPALGPAPAHAPAHASASAPTHPSGHAKPISADDERPKPKRHGADKDADLLDPTTRMAAQLAPPVTPAAMTATEEVTHRSRVSLEEVIPQVLKRIAWGGDRVKGAVHLELCSGDKVTVHAEGRRVRVEVAGNADLEKRIESRLRAAGIEVESVR